LSETDKRAAGAAAGIAADPTLSVVVPTASPWDEIREKIAPFIAQTMAAGIEVIVANGNHEPTWPEEFRRRVTWLSLPDADIFELRALGCDAATTDIVAITEDHCIPATDWCTRIRAVFAERPDCIVVGGAVINGSETSAIDRANFTITFARYLPDALTALIPAISNMAVRRQWLLTPMSPGWLEFDFLPTMSLRPGAIVLLRDICVTHVQSNGFGTLSSHFHNGRASGGLMKGHSARGRLLPAVRAGWSSGSAITRVTYGALKMAGYTTPRRSARMVMVTILMMLHSVGMVIGIKWGPGRSAGHLG